MAIYGPVGRFRYKRGPVGVRLVLGCPGGFSGGFSAISPAVFSPFANDFFALSVLSVLPRALSTDLPNEFVVDFNGLADFFAVFLALVDDCFVDEFAQ